MSSPLCGGKHRPYNDNYSDSCPKPQFAAAHNMCCFPPSTYSSTYSALANKALELSWAAGIN